VRILTVLFLSSAALAWRGHGFEQWREVTTWKQPKINNPQAGRKELVSLLGVEGAAPIDEIKAWENRRSEYAGTIRRILGEPSGDLTSNPGDRTSNATKAWTKEPTKEPRASARAVPTTSENAANPSPRARPAVQVLGEETLPDHIRRHIRIQTEPDDWIPAYLLLPKELPPGRHPTMLCLHQTVRQGKEEPCGMKGDPELDFALELVRRGFVCIAPDVIGFGERIPPGTDPYHDSISFYRKHPNWSFMGKMIHDVGRVIDYLATLDFVDPLQIGSIGHSHGAYGTLFAAAFEPRISLAIASCGFTTFRTDPHPDRWSHKTALIPQLGTYLPDVSAIPFDWQHVCALIAPRPLYVWYATRDDIFPVTDNLDSLFQDLRGVYGLYGAADDLTWKWFDGAHRFPADAREAAYAWLEERFFPTGNLRSTPKTRARWEEQRTMLRQVIGRTLGRLPERAEPYRLEVLESKQLERYERKLIEYPVGDSERVKAYLFLPKGAARGSQGGVLVLHQTVADGKREPAGLSGDAYLAFAADLANHGLVTLAPDSIAAGERIGSYKPFDTRGHYLRHPDLSAMGKMLHDGQRALDVLVAFGGVDPQHVGAIGHSLGAEQALMLAAFDERVKAVVASCGYATFAAETNRLRWARDSWFSYMPKLRPVFQLGRLPHWDWSDVARLVAPRGLFLHNTVDDEIFTESESAYQAGEAARPLWDLYDVPKNRFINVLRPGKHAISSDTKAEMYAWLERQLK
jgi:dienelactone hydrolase